MSDNGLGLEFYNIWFGQTEPNIHHCFLFFYTMQTLLLAITIFLRLRIYSILNNFEAFFYIKNVSVLHSFLLTIVSQLKLSTKKFRYLCNEKCQEKLNSSRKPKIINDFVKPIDNSKKTKLLIDYKSNTLKYLLVKNNIHSSVNCER